MQHSNRQPLLSTQKKSKRGLFQPSLLILLVCAIFMTASLFEISKRRQSEHKIGGAPVGSGKMPQKDGEQTTKPQFSNVSSMGSSPRSGSPQAPSDPAGPSQISDPSISLEDRPSSSDSQLPTAEQPEIKRLVEPNISKPSDSPYIERRSPNVGSPSRARPSSISPGSGSPRKLPRSPLISRSPLGKQKVVVSPTAQQPGKDPSSSSGLVLTQSEMGPVRVDESLRPYYETQSDCSDPILGFEVLVKPCREIHGHYIHLTANERTYVPMVINPTGKCQQKECTARDRTTCCIQRQQCKALYQNTGSTKCPPEHVPNIYPYAYCRTNPCTVADLDICCIKTQVVQNRQFNERYTLIPDLQTRTDESRSKQARVTPGDNAAYAEPHISIDYEEMAWFDMERRRKVDMDYWAPLVNFMETWGPENGWKTEAWMKVRKGEHKYKTYQVGPTEPLDPATMMKQIIIAN